MKKSANIWDMLKNQGQKNNVACPACGILLRISDLNDHLDKSCPSTSTDFKTTKVKEDNSIEIFNSKSSDIASSSNKINAASSNLKNKRTKRSNLKKSELSTAHKSKQRKIVASTNNTESHNIEKSSKTYDTLEDNFVNNESDDAVFSSLVDDSDSKSNIIKEDANDGENNSNTNITHNPYYIANFQYIIKCVLEDESNKKLFNDTDLHYIDLFHHMSDAAQKLYVRLFQRKYKWLRPYRIKYPEIGDDLTPVLLELVNSELVLSGAEHVDLETALNLLSLSETKLVSKHFNFCASGKNKGEMVQELLKHGKQHKSVFFMNGTNSISRVMLKKVQQIMGPCYRLALEPKRLFTRILMLFSLPTLSDDDEEAAGGQQQQLLTLLQVNKGELTFPNYKVHRETVIFEDRDELIRYEEARQLENDILNAIEAKNFNLAKDLYLCAVEAHKKTSGDKFSERPLTMLPFLRRYTAGHVYIRCLTQGVDILQRLREYEEAVNLLRELLNQTDYCQDYKGRWYDRLALNLEQHLRQPDKAVEAIKDSLNDKNVRVGHRLSLLTRAERLINKTKDDELKTALTNSAEICEAPKVIIKGRLFPRPIVGRRNVFISSSFNEQSCENDITILNVEQLTMEHYKSEGYIEGIHGEGSTFISIYALFFWDIIYDGSIPDAFISPYQTHPLDLNSECFFERRKEQITSHLETIKNMDIEEIKGIAKESWDLHFGNASLVNWDLFESSERVQGLLGCLGNTIIAGICERLAKDFRFTRSGVPDLVVWNPESGLIKIVEVKGPGDKLSTKQILWLDYLLKIGADAEVCHVEAVGSKKLHRN